MLNLFQTSRQCNKDRETKKVMRHYFEVLVVGDEFVYHNFASRVAGELGIEQCYVLRYTRPYIKKLVKLGVIERTGCRSKEEYTVLTKIPAKIYTLGMNI